MRTRRFPKTWFIPIVTLLVILIAGTSMTFGDLEWYSKLIKPDWQPPSELFGPVWSLLYLFITIAAWRSWESVTKKDHQIVFTLFSFNALFNLAWTPLFFGIHAIDLALLDAILMQLTTLALMYLVWKYDRLAVFLLLPYLAWVGFAIYLNFTIWQLNV